MRMIQREREREKQRADRRDYILFRLDVLGVVLLSSTLQIKTHLHNKTKKRVSSVMKRQIKNTTQRQLGGWTKYASNAVFLL